MSVYHILTPWIKHPNQVISIRWEVDGGSGSTECQAWRGQHEIECLQRAGYHIVEIYLA